MPDSPAPTLKTTFSYVQIPGFFQEKLGDWTGRVKRLEKGGLDAAKRAAEADPSVGYFCHTKTDFNLDFPKGGSQFFKINDADLFTGDHLWLGSASDWADTYLIAETYDTSDAATQTEIMKQLTLRLRTDSYVDTSGHTDANPAKVVVGLVYCDFSDRPGDKTDDIRKKILGPDDSGLANFYKTQSGGRVAITVEDYRPAGTAATVATPWQRLSGTAASYKDKFASIVTEVDGKIQFPTSWNIAVFVFPVAAANVDYDLQRSHCATTSLDTGSKKIPVVLVDSTHYDDPRGAHRTTIHEVGHALGLTDLYDSDMWRSYGWSVMSDVKSGWQLTEFEKLLLGWRDLKDFTVLKRGMVPLDPVLAGTKRGVIVLPDPTVGRYDILILEQAQKVGMTEADRDKNFTDRGTSPGILALVARRDNCSGRINPLVAKRPSATTFLTVRESYGGASLAPFTGEAAFEYNGVQSYGAPGYRTGDKQTITRVLSVNPAAATPRTAFRLRENQRIAITTAAGRRVDFGPEVDGTLLGLLDLKGVAVDGSIKGLGLKDTDYGHTLSVDGNGQVVLSASVDPTEKVPKVVKTWPAPTGTQLPTGSYVLTLRENGGKVCLAVARRVSGQADEWKYDAFQLADLTQGWQKTDGDYLITLERGFGNLLVRKISKGPDDYRGGTYTTVLTDKAVAGVSVGTDGKLTFLGPDGATLTTYPAPSGQTFEAPFALTVRTVTGTTKALALQDAKKRQVNDIFSWTE